MSEVTFYNRRLLCHTDLDDFTDFQGVGHDPMYNRFESVESIVKSAVDAQYHSFFARPFLVSGSDTEIINWYVDEWEEIPSAYNRLDPERRKHYEHIKNETISHYKERAAAIKDKDNRDILQCALKYIDDQFLFCYDDKVVLIAWGMRPNMDKHIVGGSWIKELQIPKEYTVKFDAGGHGRINNASERTYLYKEGCVLEEKDLPKVEVDEDFVFKCWTPNPIGYVVNADTVFSAEYDKIQLPEPEPEPVAPPEPEYVNVVFNAGQNGSAAGETSFRIPKGSTIPPDKVPLITPNEGFRFAGWTPRATEPINEDAHFNANYEEEKVVPPALVPLPWYKRLWNWIKDNTKGCLKYLLYFLLILLLLWLLSWLLRGCDGCSRRNGDTSGQGYPTYPPDEIGAVDKIDRGDGTVVDDNGAIKDITNPDGTLPEEPIVPPTTGDDGNPLPIQHNDGMPDIVANRLNIYFEKEDADLDKWASDFKKVYPSDDYRVIGSDKNVRMIQIQIPEEQRDRIREEITKKIPDQPFFVVDETIIRLNGKVSPKPNDNDRGWHLRATNVQSAWKITKGSSDVVVAVVDDGIEANHPMFSGRIYKAYNVFTQNRNLSVGEGHGTHVAALAAGNGQFFSKGASGVATECKIMPIQVFDNEKATFSSIASGIMYAIHNGANVVNISVGPIFKGLEGLPMEEQQRIASQMFKNEEKVYSHIISTANKKNVILVFAAGNDNILTAILPECREADKTINVAAISPQLQAAEFTNYAEGTNTSAPGVNIYSAYPEKDFAMLDGTSMAAPIVSGTVALMKSIKPDITVEQILCVFNRTGKTVTGNVPSMVQIDEALKMVQAGDFSNCKSIDNPKTKDGDDAKTPEAQSDDYKLLREMLEELKRQRASIDAQIDEIQKKIGG